ncbi:ferric reductase-like transmembrane domain-containing protein [Endozoicomonas atrinae]|uniref:ferredoxin reductase family protein n=1 Tax=Endozoicomonas atrinae TaxID=1333660 RepID=UPI003B006C16
MKRLILLFSVIYIACQLLFIPENPGFFFWRHQIVLFSGFVGFGLMTLCMVLALRPGWLETRLHGLDKLYHLHKRAGITAGIFMILHWLAVKSGPWMVSAELVSRPIRTGGAGEVGIFSQFHGEAVSMGEWAFYAMLILITISLIHRFQYQKFSLSHKLLGIVYLLGATHSIMLTPHSGGNGVIAILILSLSITGFWAVWVSLSGQIGRKKKHSGQIIQVERPAEDIMVVTLKLDNTIDYLPGQFAFIDFRDGEKAHPFTILHYSPDTREIEFAIKKLGDYTEHLITSLESGSSIILEGPYGGFISDDSREQIWIGSGVGIAPFVAMSRFLEKNSPGVSYPVTLYYCVHSEAEAIFLPELKRIADNVVGMTVVPCFSDNGSCLHPGTLQARHTLSESEVMFCGATSFGESLRRTLTQYGLVNKCFEQERFEFR